MNTNKGIEEFETGELCPNCGKPIISGRVAFGNIIIKRKCECVILQEEAERRRNIEKGTGIIRQYMIKKSGTAKTVPLLHLYDYLSLLFTTLSAQSSAFLMSASVTEPFLKEELLTSICCTSSTICTPLPAMAALRSSSAEGCPLIR